MKHTWCENTQSIQKPKAYKVTYLDANYKNHKYL